MNGLRNDTALGANMNERIRELSKDADLDWHKHWNDDETNRLEKFAELILKDVFNLFGDEILSLHYLEQGCCEDSVHLLKSKIQEHFGIEQ
jgi:hypothetical protein